MVRPRSDGGAVRATAMSTQTNANLQEEIVSITTHLYALTNDTTVWPGHGDKTTIGESKSEYAVFAAKEHAPDLRGDVLWATS